MSEINQYLFVPNVYWDVFLRVTTFFVIKGKVTSLCNINAYMWSLEN